MDPVLIFQYEHELTQNPSTLVSMKKNVHPQKIKGYIMGLDPSTFTSNNIALSGNGVCSLNDHVNGDNETIITTFRIL
jgi:hypothetical protein